MAKKIFTILQLIILFGFVSGLHDEPGRLQILSMIIHTMVMRENDKLATDVYLTELATLTENFSGAEIEGLMRCAQATAINQLIKVRRSDFTLCSHICTNICCNDGSEQTVHSISSDFHSLEILNTIFICKTSYN